MLLNSNKKYKCQTDWIALFGRTVHYHPLSRLLGKPNCLTGGKLIEKYSCQVNPVCLTSALSLLGKILRKLSPENTS